MIVYMVKKYSISFLRIYRKLNNMVVLRLTGLYTLRRPYGRLGLRETPVGRGLKPWNALCGVSLRHSSTALSFTS